MYINTGNRIYRLFYQEASKNQKLCPWIFKFIFHYCAYFVSTLQRHGHTILWCPCSKEMCFLLKTQTTKWSTLKKNQSLIWNRIQDLVFKKLHFMFLFIFISESWGCNTNIWSENLKFMCSDKKAHKAPLSRWCN